MNKKILLFAFPILLLVSISCRLPLGGPQPARTVPASTESASQILDNLGSSIANPDAANEITVTLTEAQLTALLVEQLSTQSDLPFQNPQVLVQNNQIEIYGLVQKGSFGVNARLVVGLGVDPAGQLTATLLSADLGPIPVPDSYLASITSNIDILMNNYVRPMTSGFQIVSVVLTEGVITIKAVKL